MTIAVPASQFDTDARPDLRWRRHAAILAGAWAALLVLFGGDVGDLAHIYWTSTTFGHCMFVPPLLGWLVWLRRRELAQVAPVGWWPGLAVVAAGGFGWLIGEASGVALFRHAGLVLMLQGSALTVLGPNVARALAFPLGYMAFLVPFGNMFEAPLQDVTVVIVRNLLGLFRVPADIDGVLITTPNGYFEVAEACSGAKFLIAMIAYSALVANVCFVSWRRRAGFLAMALTVPILANGVRAFGTIYVAYWTSVERATGVDHIVYGWVFFAVVMAMVLAIGWHWFDRDPDARYFDPATLQVPVARRIDAPVGAFLALAIASAFLGWGNHIDARADTLPERIALPQVPGWRLAGRPATDWAAHYPTADRYLQARYVDPGGQVVDLAVAIYAHQNEDREVVKFGQGAIHEDDKWVRVADLPDLDGGRAIRMTAPGPVERETVTWYRIGDTVTGSEERVKLETLEAKLLGGRQRAVAVLMSAPRTGQDSRIALRRFLNDAGPIDRMVDAMLDAGVPAARPLAAAR